MQLVKKTKFLFTFLENQKLTLTNGEKSMKNIYSIEKKSTSNDNNLCLPSHNNSHNLGAL